MDRIVGRQEVERGRQKLLHDIAVVCSDGGDKTRSGVCSDGGDGGVGDGGGGRGGIRELRDEGEVNRSDLCVGWPGNTWSASPLSDGGLERFCVRVDCPEMTKASSELESFVIILARTWGVWRFDQRPNICLSA